MYNLRTLSIMFLALVLPGCQPMIANPPLVAISMHFDQSPRNLWTAFSVPKVGSIYLIRDGIPYEILALRDDLSAAATAPWYFTGDRSDLGQERIGTLEVHQIPSRCAKQTWIDLGCKGQNEITPINLVFDLVQEDRLNTPSLILEVLNRPLTGDPAFQDAEDQVIAWRATIRDAITAQPIGESDEGIALCIGTDELVKGRISLQSKLMDTDAAGSPFATVARDDGLSFSGSFVRTSGGDPNPVFYLPVSNRPTTQAIFQKIYLTSFTNLPQFEFSLGEVYALPVSDEAAPQ